LADRVTCNAPVAAAAAVAFFAGTLLSRASD
jgi:hypothetical protein